MAVAIPFDHLPDEIVVEATIAGVPMVALWQPGTSAALEAPNIEAPNIEDGRNIGAAGAFRAELNGGSARFAARDRAIYDIETDSRWNALGAAVEGPLTDTRLEPLVSGTHFWFIWSIFKPGTTVLAE